MEEENWRDAGAPEAKALVSCWRYQRARHGVSLRKRRRGDWRKLFVAEAADGVEVRGFEGGIDAEEEADTEGDDEAGQGPEE